MKPTVARWVARSVPGVYGAARDAGLGRRDAVRVLEASAYALAVASKRYPRQWRAENAVRHFVWQAWLDRDVRAPVAEAVGRAHERMSADADDPPARSTAATTSSARHTARRTPRRSGPARRGPPCRHWPTRRAASGTRVGWAQRPARRRRVRLASGRHDPGTCDRTVTLRRHPLSQADLAQPGQVTGLVDAVARVHRPTGTSLHRLERVPETGDVAELVDDDRPARVGPREPGRGREGVVEHQPGAGDLEGALALAGPGVLRSSAARHGRCSCRGACHLVCDGAAQATTRLVLLGPRALRAGDRVGRAGVLEADAGGGS